MSRLSKLSTFEAKLWESKLFFFVDRLLLALRIRVIEAKVACAPKLPGLGPTSTFKKPFNAT